MAQKPVQPVTRYHMFPVSQASADRPAGVANWAIVGIFVIMTFGALAAGRAFLMPVCLGMLLFFVFVPFRRWMDRHGVPSGATAGIVTAGMVLAVAALGYFVSGPAGQLIDDAPRISRELKQKYEEFRGSFRGIEQAAQGVGELVGGSSAPAVVVAPAAPATPGATTTATTTAPAAGQPATTEITTTAPAATGATTARGAARGAAPTATSTVTVEVKNGEETTSALTSKVIALAPEIVSQTLFTLLFLFFLLAAGDLLYLRIVQSFDSMKDKRAAYQALREIENSLGNYLGAISIINVGVGVVSGLVMWAWGMPSPLLWGVAAGLLNYVPYIGPAIGYLSAALVAFIVFGDLWTGLLVGASYFSITAIEGQLITPYFVSRRLQLNPVVVFLTVALWAWLWSILGMVVAVPMLVVIRVLSQHIPALEKFGNFLAGEDPPQLSDDDEVEETPAPPAPTAEVPAAR